MCGFGSTRLRLLEMDRKGIEHGMGTVLASYAAGADFRFTCAEPFFVGWLAHDLGFSPKNPPTLEAKTSLALKEQIALQNGQCNRQYDLAN